MKRFPRWLFNGVAALSLVLCVATCVLWQRSYWYKEQFAYDIVGPSALYRAEYYISSDQGTTSIGYWSFTFSTAESSAIYGYDTYGGPGFYHRYVPPNPNTPLGSTDSFLHRRGFAYDHGKDQETEFTNSYYAATLPDWFIVLLFLTFPFIVAVRIRRRRALAMQGRCAFCGYDLRATPDRCPECGAVPAQYGASPPAL